MMQKKSPYGAKHIGRSKQEYCISFFGLKIVFTAKDFWEQLIAAIGICSMAALSIFSLGLYAGVI